MTNEYVEFNKNQINNTTLKDISNLFPKDPLRFQICPDTGISAKWMNNTNVAMYILEFQQNFFKNINTGEKGLTQFIVNAKSLFDILKKGTNKDNVKLQVTEKKLLILFNKTRVFKLPVLNFEAIEHSRLGTYTEFIVISI